MRKIWNYRQLQNQQTIEALNNCQMPTSYGEFMPMQQANGKTAAGIYHNGTWYNSEPMAYPSYNYQPVQAQAVQLVQPQQQQEPYNNQAYCYQPVQPQVGQLQMYNQPKNLTYEPTSYNCQAVQLMQPTVVPQQVQQFANTNTQPYFYQSYNQQPVQLTPIQTGQSNETFNMQPYNNQLYQLQSAQLTPVQGALQQSEQDSVNFQPYDMQPFIYPSVQLDRKEETTNMETVNLPTYDSQSYEFEPMPPEQLSNASQQPDTENINLQPYQEDTCNCQELETIEDVQQVPVQSQPLQAAENLKEQQEVSANYAPSYDCEICKQLVTSEPAQMPSFAQEASELSTIQIDLSTAADVLITRTQLKLVIAISKRPGCVQGKTELAQRNVLNDSNMPADGFKTESRSFQHSTMEKGPVEVQLQTEALHVNPGVENVEPIGKPTESGKPLNGMNKAPVLQQSSMEASTVMECPLPPTSTFYQNQEAVLSHITEFQTLTQANENIESINYEKNMPDVMQQFRAPRRIVPTNFNQVFSPQPDQTKSLNFDLAINDMNGQSSTNNMSITPEEIANSKPSNLINNILFVNPKQKPEILAQSIQKSSVQEKLFPQVNSKIVLMKNFERIAQEANKVTATMIFQKKSSVVTTQTIATPTILRRNSEMVEPEKTVSILRSSTDKSDLPQNNSTQSTSTLITSVQAGIQSTWKSLVSNSKVPKVPQFLKASQVNSTTTKMVSRKHTEHTQHQIETPVIPNFSILKRTDKVQPETSCVSFKNSTGSIKSYTVYSKSKINTESFKFITSKDNKVTVPHQTGDPHFVTPKGIPEILASEKSKMFVEPIQELPHVLVTSKDMLGKHNLTETLVPEKLKCLEPQKRDLPLTVPSKYLQENHATGKHKISGPQKPEMPISVTPIELTGKSAQDKIKLVPSHKQEVPVAVSILKRNNIDVAPILDKNKAQVPQKQEPQGTGTAKELIGKLAPEKNKLPVLPKRELPPTVAFEHLQGKTATGKSKIAGPQKQEIPISVTPMELPGKLAQEKIKLVPSNKQNISVAVSILKRNNIDVPPAPKTDEITTPNPISKQKIFSPRPAKSAAETVPTAKKKKIDSLILNAFSDKTETEPFGSRQQNQPKKQQKKMSKLERKVLRRRAKEEQEQLLAEKKEQEKIKTNQSKEVDKNELEENIIEKPKEDQPEGPDAELDKSTEAQYLEMKGLKDPHIRRSLARIIQKITKL